LFAASKKPWFFAKKIRSAQAKRLGLTATPHNAYMPALTR
jgi:hypothetical protein